MGKRLLPPTYFVASVFLMAALEFVAPVMQVLAPPWRMGGWLAIAIGVGLDLAADQALKARKTTVEPFRVSSALVTSGVFRFTRNPMYLGMILILLGIAAALGSLSPFLVCAAFALLLRLRFVPVEERMLAEAFGNQWEAYRAGTRRWI